MFSYTKTILERVSFDPLLFCKEVEKALKILLPYEIEQLTDWLFQTHRKSLNYNIANYY